MGLQRKINRDWKRMQAEKDQAQKEAIDRQHMAFKIIVSHLEAWYGVWMKPSLEYLPDKLDGVLKAEYIEDARLGTFRASVLDDRADQALRAAGFGEALDFAQTLKPSDNYQSITIFKELEAAIEKASDFTGCELVAFPENRFRGAPVTPERDIALRPPKIEKPPAEPIGSGQSSPLVIKPS